MSERQMLFAYDAPSPAATPIPVETPRQTVEEIAASLRPQVLAYLHEADGDVGIHELRSALGHPALDSEHDPQANPVNRILKEMHDAGELLCNEPEWGEPTFSLPVGEHEETAPVRSNREGEHSLELFAIGDSVEFEIAGACRFGELVAVEDALNNATVHLIPSGEQMTLSQDLLRKVRPDPLAYDDGGDHVSRASDNKGVDALDHDHRPYTLDDYRTFRGQLDEGQLTAADLQTDFRRLQASREQFISVLQQTYNATQLKNLALRVGCFDARRNNKGQNAAAIFRNLSGSFALGRSVMYQPMSGQSYKDTVAKVVAEITDDDLARFVEEHRAEAARDRKAIENPETLDEFRMFVSRNGADALSHHQLVTFDRLRADRSRSERAAKTSSTIEQFATNTKGLQITTKQGFHDKKQIPLWICQLNQRVDADTFRELKIKASQLGGWYSSFKKADAGFQFTTVESALKFQRLLAGDVDRSDELADRKTRKMDTASERLLDLADDLQQRSEALLQHGHTTLQNTVRRSEMAAGTRGRANAQIAFAGTMRSLAASLGSGDAMYLDGIRTMTQLSALQSVLRRGKTRRNKQLLDDRGALGVWERHLAVEDLDNRRLAIEDADFAEYPVPTVYKRALQEAILAAESRKGVMQRARKMKKWLQTDDDFITFTQQYEIEAFTDFCQRCRAVGIDVEWLERSLENYKRLQSANIHTTPELRMALRELVPHLQKKREDDPVLKAEQELIGKNIPGFFPTPKAVISRMLELAEIKAEHKVLEPSAGKGDILDMLREHHPDAQVHAIEMNGTLFDVLETKEHKVERGDFLEHCGAYDRIVMNPPFANGQDIDHVRHAFDQLAEDGRVVAIMSEGPFFRSDRKAEAFRDWLDEHGGESEQLPDEAFGGNDSFRKTGVRTRIVTIMHP